MLNISEIKNTILHGDIIKNLKNIPTNSIDLIFADPPYFMQTEGQLLRTEGTKFSGVDDDWDKFENYQQYDKFCTEWLIESKRILKDNGTIWVIGAFQNIYRIGYIMQNLGFWILNDVIWSKPNPVPNFKGTRFTNASETMLWCTKNQKAKYTFNYKTMKHLNNGKQMKSVWNIGLCIGNERIKNKDGKKAHSTQKPEALLMNVILSASKVGDIVLDPFMGSGTTAAVAKLTNRNFIGIEREKKYIKVANERLKKIIADTNNPIYNNLLDIRPPRVSVVQLIENNYLKLGEDFYTNKEKPNCKLHTDGHLINTQNEVFSIHKMSAKLLQKTNHNGWDFWKVKRNKKLVSINDIRSEYLKKELNFVAFDL